MNRSFITIPRIFSVHKCAGKLPNCRFVKNPEDIPYELTLPNLDSNGNCTKPAAATLSPNETVVLISNNESAERTFPFFMEWEATKYGYNAWPRDNGFNEFIYDLFGNCYEKVADNTKMPRYKACKIDSIFGEQDTTDTEHQKNLSTHSVLIQFQDCVKILTLDDNETYDYYVEVDGVDIGSLADILS